MSGDILRIDPLARPFANFHERAGRLGEQGVIVEIWQ